MLSLQTEHHSLSTLVRFTSHLCAGGSNGSTRHLDIKTAFRVLLTPQTGVIWRFPGSFPVTDSFSNSLENAAEKCKNTSSVV